MQIIIEAKQLLDLKPKIWEVHVGAQISPIREELYATVYKQEFEKLFDILRLGRICDFLNRSKSQILPEQSISWKRQ